jgi:hypothetical protein
MGLPLVSVLHGEQTYSYDSEIVAGDAVSFTTTLSSVHVKKGSKGQMTFLTFETAIDVTAPKPRRAGSSKTMIIAREIKKEGDT